MFDHINSILYKKPVTTIPEAINEDVDFQPYMIQRWCSMHSAPVAHIINETTNRYWNVLEDNKEWYMSLATILPTCKFKRIAYIKKSKKESSKKIDDAVLKIADRLEISSREVNQYIEYFNINIDKQLQNEQKNT